jgi:hypothetical protein
MDATNATVATRIVVAGLMAWLMFDCVAEGQRPKKTAPIRKETKEKGPIRLNLSHKRSWHEAFGKPRA